MRCSNIASCPIINENDAVATAEIKVGDNDNLSALVALLAEADLLLLLTDQAGLFTADPRTDPDAQLIPEVRTIDETLRRLAGGSVSGLGVGGMTTKLQAADVARRAGADVVIAAGRAPDVILRAVARGGDRHALPRPGRAAGEPQALDLRRHHARAAASRWMPARRGRSRENGSSLLPAGIVAVEGDSSAAIPCCIVGPEGNELARGIVRYDSADLAQHQGLPLRRRSPSVLGYDVRAGGGASE